MLTEEQIRRFAMDWVSAWNAHDLEAILSHYSSDVVLTSPVAAKLLNEASGTVSGKESLRKYFQRGLEAYPDLCFQLLDVTLGVTSVVLYYSNQSGTHTAEFMEFDSDGRVTTVIANYGLLS